jgi:hypothetical protein
MKKTNLTQLRSAWVKIQLLGFIIPALFLPNRLKAQTCAPEAEFSYNPSVYCQNGPDAVVTHTTGINGVYTFSVVSGGSNLALNSSTGAIDVSASSPGVFNVTNTVNTGGNVAAMIITGVLDGPLTGGTPKAIEFYVISPIPNLSIYGFSSANNGGGPTGTPEFTFPALLNVPAGTRFWVASEVPNFNAYFGFNPNFTSGAANINGDDAIELFCNGVVIDVFGDVNVDGTGQPWDYEDGWAYRKNNTPPNGNTFVLGNWNFSGPNALDFTTTNATAPMPWPIMTFSFTTLVTCTKQVQILAPPFANAGPNQLVCENAPVNLAATGTGSWSGGLGTFNNPNIPNAVYTPAAPETGTTVILTWTATNTAGGPCSATDQTFITILKKPDAEFSYNAAQYCPNGSNPILSHITGTDGIYSYMVISGGPTLALNTQTGAINIAASNRGTYKVTNSVSGCGNMVISGVIDGPITGGLPKAVEFTALTNIPDLSTYGFGSANNGGGTDGEEFTFPAVAITAGTRIWVATEVSAFQSFFGFAPTYTNNIAPSINGDDAIELFCNGVVIDVFGDINVDGTGQPWDYEDGWAYRVINTGPDGSFFELGNWIFSGANALDNQTMNATSPIPMPINTFTSNKGGVCPNAVFSQNIIVDDTQAPTITCPADFVITLNGGECSAAVDFNVTATDDCDPNPVITQIDNTGLGSGDFFEIGTTILEFKATDATGNMATCSFAVVIHEYPNPVSFVTCNQLVQVSLDENGMAVVGADMVLEGGPYHCYDDYTVDILTDTLSSLGDKVNCSHIGKTFIVKVMHPDNGNSCWGQLIVEDKIGPVLTCQNRTVPCTQNVTATSPTRPTAKDNCDSSPDIKLLELILIDDDICNDNMVKYRRSWIAFDDYANASQPCSEIITVQRPTNVNFPNDATFSCPNSNPSAGSPTGLSGLFCNYSVTSSDEILTTCPGVTNVFKIIRTWTVLDWCTGTVITSGFNDTNNNGIKDPGEVTEDNIQLIKVVDEVPPTITADNLTVNINVAGVHPQPCRSTGTIPSPGVTDNCSGVQEIHIFTPIGEAIGNKIPAPGLGLGTHPITITAIDRCGNFTTKQITLTVVDNLAPVTICDEITDVNLSSDGIATVFAETFDDGSTDNCCLSHFEVRRMNDPCGSGSTNFGPSVTFCCADVGAGPQTVIMRAYDCHDLYNDCMVVVNVQDKQAPVLSNCPQDKRITCDWYAQNLETQLSGLAPSQSAQSLFLDQFFGTPTFIDNCAPKITRTYAITIDQCLEGTITRTWRASDNSVPPNQSALCTQRVFIDHISDWVVEFPQDITVFCQNDTVITPSFGHPKVFFETCELVAISQDDKVFTVVPDACFKVIRTWTVINWCVVGAEVNQEVVESPESAFGFPLSNCDFDGDNDCDTRTFRDSWNKLTGTHSVTGQPYKQRPGASDAASSLPIYNPDTDPDSDPWDGYITYEQVIKVQDNGKPLFVNGCPQQTVEILGNSCLATFNVNFPAVDDCVEDQYIKKNAQIKIGNTWLSAVINGIPQSIPDVAPGTYEVKYLAEDMCNNQTACNSTLKVLDKKKPTPYCENGLIIELMNTTPPLVQVWASDFDKGSFDNCPGTLKFSFSGNTSYTGRTFNCDSVDIQIPIEMWVTDAAGNQDFCKTFILVQDNMTSCPDTLSVQLAGVIATEINESVNDVQVQLSGDSQISLMTNNSGAYSFNVPVAGDYTITPLKDIDPLNGVTTFDLVLISKHILGTQMLDSPYKIIAADANKSNSVTTFDLVQLRKLILFIDTDFPNNTSWRFVDKKYFFQDPTNPFSKPFPEVINVNNLTASQLDAHFIAIKVGDVNGSAKGNFAALPEDRHAAGSLVFGVEDAVLNAGETYTVNFKAKDFRVSGYQFTLNFDHDDLDFVSMVPATASEENFGFSFLDQGIITTSWNKENVKVTDGETLFSLVFKAKENAILSRALSIGSRYTVAEAYAPNGDLLNVQLAFNGSFGGAQFELYQNTPNPFSGKTTIGFYLPEAAAATVTLTDIAGKVVKICSGDYARGYNEIIVSQKDLPLPGVYFYRLDTERYSATRKMVVVD